MLALALSCLLAMVPNVVHAQCATGPSECDITGSPFPVGTVIAIVIHSIYLSLCQGLTHLLYSVPFFLAIGIILGRCRNINHPNAGRGVTGLFPARISSRYTILDL